MTAISQQTSVRYNLDVFKRDDLFAANLLTIRTKKMQLMRFKYNRAQRDSYARIQATGKRKHLWVKSRQLGFSTMLQAILFRANCYHTSASLTLADTIDNTIKMRAISNLFYAEWPREFILIRPPRDQDSAVRVTYPRTRSESLIATAGAHRAGQGATYNYVHLSELAHYNEDSDNVFASALQAATPDAYIFGESTPNGAQGKFYELCQRALDGDGEWVLHFYPWWWASEYRVELEDGEIITPTPEEEETILKAHQNGFELTPEQIKWRRSKILDIPTTFLQEYPEDVYTCFLRSGSGVFGDFSKTIGKETNYEYCPDHRYIAAIDWGESIDYTVICIIDKTANCEVVLDRWNRLPVDTTIRRLADYCLQWHVEKICPEANSIGSVYSQLLVKALEKNYTNHKVITLVNRFTTTNELKRMMVDELHYALSNGFLTLLPDNIANDELRKFCSKQNVNGTYRFEAVEGAHDDTVIARMAANYFARHLIG